MYQIRSNANAMQLNTNFVDKNGMDTIDMNNYPNVLTPPMDSPESMMLSPSSGSSSPHQNYLPQGVIQPYSFNTATMQVQASNFGSNQYLTVIEEPVDRFRFRYKSEMAGTHGSLTGRNSDRTRKQTYPTVELHNYDKPAVIRCSLYQYGREDMAHTRQPHAHRLVKKQGTDEIDDPHDMHVDAESGYVGAFHSMGIIHTAKKYIVPELLRKNTKLREEEIARVEHKCRPLTRKEDIEVKVLAEKESKSINLNIVCLRFDAFKVVNNIYYPLCDPIYSNSINNLKSALTGDLKIVRMDHCTSPCRGGREIFILVEKVTKKNIKIRFYELDDEDNETWSAFGRFNDLDVHHQYAIVFKTPPYRTLDIDKQVKVCIELQRPSDGARSEPKDFVYTPCEITLGRKRARCSSSYDSSNYSSDELPLTLNNIPVNGQAVMNNFADMNMVVNSKDLEDALKHGNINSAEFDKICNNLMQSGPIESFYAEDIHLTPDDLRSLTVDAPKPIEDRRMDFDMKSVLMMEAEIDCLPSRSSTVAAQSNKLSASNQQIVDRVRKELIAFIKTNPMKKRVSIMLENLFQNQTYVSTSGDTVLHLLVSENNSKNNFLLFLLKVLLKYQQNELINIRNKKGQTALHLAVENHNLAVVEHLVYTKADISVEDMNGNTALHVAVLKNVPVTILKLLLSPGRNIEKYINTVNYGGHTALHLAVKNGNIPATKLLCWNHADVNMDHKKNGHTALHMAVADQRMDIINFLLESTDVQPEREDYIQCNSLKLAKELIDDRPVTREIYRVLENFMKKNGSFEEVDVKEEVIEDMSDDDIEDFKEEPMSPECLRTKYSKVQGFSEKILNEVSTILDKSGTWQNLADLLDYGHLLRTTNLFNSMEKPSKSLLNFAIANGDSVLQIRDFLENLDEVKAVELLDNMVLKEEYEH